MSVAASVGRPWLRVLVAIAFGLLFAAVGLVCSCGVTARTRVDPASSRAGHSVDETRPTNTEESGSKIVVTLPPVVSKQLDAKKGGPR